MYRKPGKIEISNRPSR